MIISGSWQPWIGWAFVLTVGVVPLVAITLNRRLPLGLLSAIVRISFGALILFLVYLWIAKAPFSYFAIASGCGWLGIAIHRLRAPKANRFIVCSMFAAGLGLLLSGIAFYFRGSRAGDAGALLVVMAVPGLLLGWLSDTFATGPTPSMDVREPAEHQ